VPPDDASERDVPEAAAPQSSFQAPAAGYPPVIHVERRAPVLNEMAAGGGLGMLVGFLLGLSVAQVVGGVVASLAALLGAFLGLSGAQTSDRALRIGAFGFLCVAGVALGLAVRAGGLLSPSVTGDVRAWTAAGYPADQARSYVAFQRLGVKPDAMTVTAPPPAVAGSSALFAGQTSVCNQLQTLPYQAQLRVLRQQGGVWAGVAATAEASGDAGQALAAGLKAICG
jgi:hypothetical protein